MESKFTVKVYDLGKKDDREKFFAENPWMTEHKWFAPLSSDSTNQVK